MFTVKWYDSENHSNETPYMSEDMAYDVRDSMRAHGQLNAVVLAYPPYA
jgi:hypothetical protein